MAHWIDAAEALMDPKRKAGESDGVGDHCVHEGRVHGGCKGEEG